MSVAVHKLLIDIYSHEYLDTIPLPLLIEGRFWLERTTGKGKIRFLEVVQNEGEYILLCEDKKRSSSAKSKILLKSGHTHEIRCQGEHILLMVRKYQKDVFVFLPYQNTDSNIEIGRSAGQAIRFENPHISKHHAQLQRVQGTWEIRDCSSVNGVYVNRMRIAVQRLKIGDHIDLLGLKLIIAPGYLLINHSKDTLVHITLHPYSPVSESLPSMPPRKPYHQSPYTCSIAETDTLELESPSTPSMKETMPLLYLLGPSITMGMSSISMAVFSLGSALLGKQDILQVVPTMLMAISMALGTILWPVLGKRYESRQQKKEQLKQIQRYDEYLLEVNQKIQEFIQREEKYLVENYPDMTILSERITSKKQLWNHKKEDAAYLCLGIGKGNRKASFTLTWEKENLSWKDNDLYQKLKKTAMTSYIVHDVPCIVNLQNISWLGLVGKPMDCQELMLQLLLQLTALHSYRVMHIMMVTRKEELSNYGCYYLPHLFSTDRSIRYLVHDTYDFKRIRQSFHQQEEEHEKIPMVIFHFDSSLHLPYPKSWMEDESCILIQHALIPEDLHHQCQKILYIGQQTLHDDNILYQYPKMNPEHMSTCFHLLSGLQIKEESITSYRELSFLDLYQCNRIEDLKILDRWAKADCIHTLEAAIGILGDGELLYLDAHEQCHGPHGLLAGMTGSGKSETILTYILSLAVTYPPSDVSFLLIDYKGGAMAETFQKLPHVAGIITNLEQESVQRYLAAIESELKRRQQLFRQTSVKYNRSSMDIEKYRSLCLEHKELHLLPHLFIIADEFAELKSLQPDFLDCLKQSARIGRSLGIHVILATQKPAGVVDDQIWSNSRFHICLKVQERSDSMEMLKQEDAAYLKHAGECYFQVGNNEIFERGLCAWTQAPYLPQDEYEPHQRKEVELIDATAQRIRVHPFPQKKTTQTQLEALLQYLHQLVQPTDFAFPLWKDVITGSLTIQTLVQDYGYQKGMYALGDDIHHQQQYPLAYPLTTLQHTAVYGMANSGKTELLMTLLYSWIQESDEMTSIVLLDFEKCGWKELKTAACICDVLQSEDHEQISSLFYQLKEQITLRKDGKASWPFLLVIHNFEIFSEEYAEQLDILHYLMREGEKVQIYVLLTVTSPGNLSYRITQYIHKTISLQLKDTSDYRLLFSDREGLCPGKEKGCGMVIEKELLLFKTAYYPVDEQKKILNVHSKENCFHIPILPEHIVEEVEYEETKLFLGLDVISKEPVYLPLYKNHWTFITGAYKVYPPFVNAILHSLQQRSIPVLICSASGIDPIEKLQQTCMSFLQEENGIILWQDFYQLRQRLDPSLVDRLLNSAAHHIVIEEIQQLQLYAAFEWFSHSLTEAVVIWSGKGFQDNQYVLKRSSKDHVDVKAENHAFIWKEDLCIELQVWEREENG